MGRWAAQGRTRLQNAGLSLAGWGLQRSTKQDKAKLFITFCFPGPNPASRSTVLHSVAFFASKAEVQPNESVKPDFNRAKPAPALHRDGAVGKACSRVVANVAKRKREFISRKRLDLNGIILEHNKTPSCLHRHYYSCPARLQAYRIKSTEGKWVSSKGNSSPHSTQSSYYNDKFPDSDHIKNPSGCKRLYGIHHFLWLFFFFLIEPKQCNSEKIFLAMLF